MAYPMWWRVVLPCLLTFVVVFEAIFAFQDQVIDLECAEMRESTPGLSCDAKNVSSAASNAAKWAQTAQGLGSLVLVGLLASVSDVFGRKPVMLLALAGYLIAFLPCVLVRYSAALRADWQPILTSLWGVSGLTGGSGVILLTMFAYIVDTVPPADWPFVFTIMEGTVALGGVVGTLAGGYLVDAIGPARVFIVLMAVLTLVLAYCKFALPESLNPARRAARVDWRMLNCLYSLRAFIDEDVLRSRNEMLVLAGALLFMYLPVQGIDTVSVLYLKAEPFSYSNGVVGIYNCIGLAARVVAGLVLAPYLRGRIKSERGELWAARIALILCGAFQALQGSAVGIYDITVYNFFTGAATAIALAYVRGLVNKSAGPTRQGRMLGAFTFILSGSQALSPLLFNSVYASTSEWFGGFAYILLGMSSLAAAGLLFFFSPRKTDLHVQEALLAVTD
eukprot:m.34004 g.34004  ORF g.34004 m.34004 type:complete len:449 (+) comp5167_c0_seq1:185-1531(+)